MSTLAKLLMAMIRKNKTDGLAEKIDVFYAAGRITEEEYIALMKALDPNFNVEESQN